MGHILKLTFFGFLSGLLSYYFLIHGYLYSPGIVFAIVTAIYFMFVTDKTSRLVVWAALVFIGYCLAVWVTFYLSFLNFWLVAPFVGGMVGTSILLFGMNYLFAPSKNKKYYIASILFGGFLGLIFYFVEPTAHLTGAPPPYYVDYLFFYVIWQTGIAGALGFMLKK